MKKGDKITSLASSVSLPFTGVLIPLIECKLVLSHGSELFPSVQYQEQHLEPKTKEKSGQLTTPFGLSGFPWSRVEVKQ